MINRTPMTGMQPRSDQQAGRGGVHYGRNPHAGGNGARHGGGAQQRENISQQRAQQPGADAHAAQRQRAGREAQKEQSLPPSSLAEPAVPDNDSAPELLKNSLFLQGHLRTWIGKTVRAEFLIGTNIIEDRTGTLTEVGANYIVIKELETRNHVLCDIHSIKFITAVEEGY